jgi:hypothetical protein
VNLAEFVLAGLQAALCTLQLCLEIA